LSHDLIQTATIQFDLGEGGAMAVVYFTIVLVVSATFFKFIIPAKAAL
jgi:glycerol transport system permease protein